jgi:hypothetical protein
VDGAFALFGAFPLVGDGFDPVGDEQPFAQSDLAVARDEQRLGVSGKARQDGLKMLERASVVCAQLNGYRGAGHGRAHCSNDALRIRQHRRMFVRLAVQGLPAALLLEKLVGHIQQQGAQLARRQPQVGNALANLVGAQGHRLVLRKGA